MTQKIDFIPAEFLRARKRRARMFRGVAVGFLISGILFALAVAVRLQVAHASTTIAPLRDSVASMREWQVRVEPLSERLRDSLENKEALGQLTKSASWVAFLDALADATNERIWITECRITREEYNRDEETQPTIARLALSGIATSDIEIIELMAALSAAPQVHEVRLETSRTSSVHETLGMIEFAMAGTLN